MTNIKTNIIIIFLISLSLVVTKKVYAEKNFFNEAKAKYDEKKLEESKFLFQRNIVFNPKDANSYLYLAKIFEEEKNDNEKDKNLNNWSIELPTNLRNNLKFNQIEPGDSILIDDIDQKASEVFRSFGVNEVLRKVWPVLKLDDKIIWIPGIRKSDDVNSFDSHIESFIINTSIEKSCFENI